MSKAAGGIIITASHNPRQWNALKLLNNEGEFLTKEDGNEVLATAEEEGFLALAAQFEGVGKIEKTHEERFSGRPAAFSAGTAEAFY